MTHEACEEMWNLLSISPGRYSPSGHSEPVSTGEGTAPHPLILPLSQGHLEPTGSTLLSSESGSGLSSPWDWGREGPGHGTCAVSKEAEEERGPGHGGGASLLLPEAG